jgi:hypothetical protein
LFKNVKKYCKEFKVSLKTSPDGLAFDWLDSRTGGKFYGKETVFLQI